MTVGADRTTERPRRSRAAASAAPHSGPFAAAAVFAGAALVTFLLAYDGGSYSLQSRSSAAIAALWLVGLAAGLGLWPVRRWTAAVLVAGTALAALAGLAALSAAWGPNAEKAVNDANRTVLYLAVLALVALAAREGSAAAWAGGIGSGIAAVGVLALASRLFPGAFREPELPSFIPAATYRLSYPLNYWNGLAVLCALGLPLLLGLALRARRPLSAGAALAPLPVLAAVVYLTSSRGGVLTAVVGVALFLALTHRRWAAFVAAGIGAPAAAAAVLVLRARPELVGEAAPEAVVAAQGRTAAWLIAGACLLCGVVYAGVSWLPVRPRVPRALSVAAVALLVVAAAVALARADPVQRLDDFRAVPSDLDRPQAGTTETHLASASGNGRWQMWMSSLDQFRAEPLRGGGAASFEYWWARNGPLPGFVLDGHSLYFETLGELGVLGLLLVVVGLGTGVAVGVGRLVRSTGSDRVVVASLLGAFTAYCVEAGFDWMWELPAVTVVASALLALLVGRATLPAAEAGEGLHRARPALMGVAVAAAALGLIAAQAVPLLADARIRQSQSRAAQGDLVGALTAAREARGIQPWAATPALQLALLAEQAGELAFADIWIQAALARDGQNWRLWVVAARIETKRGRFDAARRSLDRALELSPRSPVLAALR